MNLGEATMRKLMPVTCALAALSLVLWAEPAAAYIGPGAGITMLGALWGVIVAIALALGAVLFWPIRILLRKRRKPAGTAPAVASDSAVARDKAS
jgi:hypothetical protein